MTFARRAVGPILLATTVCALVGFAVLSRASSAAASSHQRAIFEDDVRLLDDPVDTLRTLRQLGVSTVRVFLHWNFVAPDPTSSSKPAGFNESDPSAYGSNFASYDTIIQDAQAQGMEVLLLVSGGAPRWATAPGIPSSRQDYGQWKPSASDYSQFFQAVATRYNGGFRPCDTCAPLPRVHFWEIWNEANWGQDLAPQANGGSTALVSAGLYRPLLDAGWGALQRTGHGHDTIILSSLSPRGHARPGAFLASEPLTFLRALYCVNSKYKQLRGGAAARLGCPTSKRASRGFRGAHPGLFNASGYGIHPYPFNLPPTRADSSDPNHVEFNEIPKMAAAVDRLQRAYSSHRHLPIYNTEYSYETNPPNHSDHFVSPQKAAFFINWAEYLSWANRRLGSYDQYLLYDPPPNQGASIFGAGGFATGLVFSKGNVPKADYAAYRLPIFLPVTSTRRGRKLEVWGCVRPAHVAQADVHQPQRVKIQLVRGHAVKTVATVTVRNPRGYFDVRVRFPRSGSVRLAWAYPPGDSTLSGGYTDPLNPGQTVFSRSVSISVH